MNGHEESGEGNGNRNQGERKIPALHPLDGPLSLHCARIDDSACQPAGKCSKRSPALSL